MTSPSIRAHSVNLSKPRLNVWQVATFAAAVLAAIWVPATHNPYYITLAVSFGITLILTTSLNLVVGISGQFCLSHAAFFGVGAYVPAILAKELSWSPWIGLPASLLCAAALATLLGIPIMRLKGYYLAVATLAFSMFIEVAIKHGGSITGGGYGISSLPPLNLLGHPLRGAHFYYLTVFIVVAVYLLINRIVDSRFGRSIKAVHDNPSAASATGINPAQIKLSVFVLASVFAALAGWLQTFYHLQINPMVLSPEWTFVWLFMVLIGGMGHRTGVVLGTLLLTIVPEFVGFATEQTVLGVGILMVLVTLFAPRGLGGILDDSKVWITRRGAFR